INHDVPGSIVPTPRPLAATMGYTATESGPGLWIVASAVHREPAAPAMGIGIQAGKRTRSKFFRSSAVAAYAVVAMRKESAMRDRFMGSLLSSVPVQSAPVPRRARRVAHSPSL